MPQRVDVVGTPTKAALSPGKAPMRPPHRTPETPAFFATGDERTIAMSDFDSRLAQSEAVHRGTPTPTKDAAVREQGSSRVTRNNTNTNASALKVSGSGMLLPSHASSVSFSTTPTPAVTPPAALYSSERRAGDETHPRDVLLDETPRSALRTTNTASLPGLSIGDTFVERHLPAASIEITRLEHLAGDLAHQRQIAIAKALKKSQAEREKILAEEAAAAQSHRGQHSHQSPRKQNSGRRGSEYDDENDNDGDIEYLTVGGTAAVAPLATWVKDNGDLTVRDVGLGPSDTPLANLPAQDGAAEAEAAAEAAAAGAPPPIGIDRYAMKGELKAWLDRIADQAMAVPTLPNDWGRDISKDIDEELFARVKLLVQKEDDERRSVTLKLVQQMTKQLAFLSHGRDFLIDPDFVPNETDQLRRLGECVDEWASHVAHHGQPGFGNAAHGDNDNHTFGAGFGFDDAKPGQGPRRIVEHGLRAAAKTSNLLLSEQQLDQVVDALYAQQTPIGIEQNAGASAPHVAQSAHMGSAADALSTVKSALQASGTDFQRRQTAVVTMKRDANAALAVSKKCERLEATIEKLELEKAKMMQSLKEYKDDPQRREDDIENLEESNALVHVAASVMSRQQIERLEAEVDRMREILDAYKRKHETIAAESSRVKEENAQLTKAVKLLKRQWEEAQRVREEKEKAREKAFGGQASALQRVQSVLTSFVGPTIGLVVGLIAQAEARTDAAQRLVHTLAEVASFLPPLDAVSGSGLALHACAVAFEASDQASADTSYSRIFEWGAHVKAISNIPDGARTAAIEIESAAKEALDRIHNGLVAVEDVAWPDQCPETVQQAAAMTTGDDMRSVFQEMQRSVIGQEAQRAAAGPSRTTSTRDLARTRSTVRGGNTVSSATSGSTGGVSSGIVSLAPVKAFSATAQASHVALELQRQQARDQQQQQQQNRMLASIASFRQATMSMTGAPPRSRSHSAHHEDGNPAIPDRSIVSPFNESRFSSPSRTNSHAGPFRVAPAFGDTSTTATTGPKDPSNRHLVPAVSAQVDRRRRSSVVFGASTSERGPSGIVSLADSLLPTSSPLTPAEIASDVVSPAATFSASLALAHSLLSSLKHVNMVNSPVVRSTLKDIGSGSTSPRRTKVDIRLPDPSAHTRSPPRASIHATSPNRRAPGQPQVAGSPVKNASPARIGGAVVGGPPDGAGFASPASAGTPHRTQSPTTTLASVLGLDKKDPQTSVSTTNASPSGALLGSQAGAKHVRVFSPADPSLQTHSPDSDSFVLSRDNGKNEVTRLIPEEFLAKVGSYERRHVNALVSRLDAAASELATVHREARFMRVTIQFLCDGVNALCDGTFDEAKHGLGKQKKQSRLSQIEEEREAREKEWKKKRKERMRGRGDNAEVSSSSSDEEETAPVESERRFPPARVVGPDDRFRFGWVEELRKLEGLYNRLRGVMGDTDTHRNVADTTIAKALECFAAQDVVTSAAPAFASAVLAQHTAGGGHHGGGHGMTLGAASMMSPGGASAFNPSHSVPSGAPSALVSPMHAKSTMPADNARASVQHSFIGESDGGGGVGGSLGASSIAPTGATPARGSGDGAGGNDENDGDGNVHSHTTPSRSRLTVDVVKKKTAQFSASPAVVKTEAIARPAVGNSHTYEVDKMLTSQVAKQAGSRMLAPGGRGAQGSSPSQEDPLTPSPNIGLFAPDASSVLGVSTSPAANELYSIKEEAAKSKLARDSARAAVAASASASPKTNARNGQGRGGGGAVGRRTPLTPPGGLAALPASSKAKAAVASSPAPVPTRDSKKVRGPGAGPVLARGTQLSDDVSATLAQSSLPGTSSGATSAFTSGKFEKPSARYVDAHSKTVPDHGDDEEAGPGDFAMSPSGIALGSLAAMHRRAKEVEAEEENERDAEQQRQTERRRSSSLGLGGAGEGLSRRSSLRRESKVPAYLSKGKSFKKL